MSAQSRESVIIELTSSQQSRGVTGSVAAVLERYLMKSLIPITALCVASLLAPSGQAVAQRNVYEQARRKMVNESVEGAGVKSKRVIESMLATPRHQFVRANLRSKAYFDMALPIGDKQTISSPSGQCASGK